MAPRERVNLINGLQEAVDRERRCSKELIGEDFGVEWDVFSSPWHCERA